MDGFAQDLFLRVPRCWLSSKGAAASSRKVICWSLESIHFAFLIPGNVSKREVVIQASEFVTYIHHHSPNLNDENYKLLLEDLPLASALACEAKHSSVPLVLLQRCQVKTSWELAQKQFGKTCRKNVVILIWIQRSKVLRLPFSVLSFWRDVHCWLFLRGKKKKTAMSRRSVSAACKQCLSACAVCRETSKGSGADQSEFFFLFLFSGSCQYSRQRPQKIRDVQEAREVVRKKKQQRIPENGPSPADLWPYANFLILPVGPRFTHTLSRTTTPKLCR